MLPGSVPQKTAPDECVRGYVSFLGLMRLGCCRDFQIAQLVAIVIAVVPMLFAPAMRVFIPPAMMLAPAAFAGFVELAAPAVRVGAVAAVTLDGLMQFMISVGDAALALLFAFGMRPRHGRKKREACD